MNLDDLVDRAAKLDNPRGLRRLRLVVIALVFMSFGTCLASGADGPPNPSFADAAILPPFAQTGFRLVPPPGSPPPPAATPTGPALMCALLADNLITRQRNLSGRGDLAGYVAMVIDHERLTVEPFTPQAISIALTAAFYDAEGNYLAAGDTVPCSTTGGCPPVAAPAPYRYLLLTPAGQFPALGGPGARLEVGGSCPAASAPPPPV